MQDNLSDMVKGGVTEEPITFHEETLDVPETETQPATSEETAVVSSIMITSLGSWFDENVNNFPNIRKPTVSIQGVDADQQLIMTILVSTKDGVEKRKLIVYDDAHIQPILDLPAIDMQIYNNGFRIVYDLGNGVFIKSYGIRKGLISVFCNDIDNQLIPYGVIRAKKQDTEIDVMASRNLEDIKRQLSEPLDFEALQLRYKQSSKTEGFRTNKEAIDWLLERQGYIEDIHHHLQIDNVIIDTLE